MTNNHPTPTRIVILDDHDLATPHFSKVCTYCEHWTPGTQGHHCGAFPTDEIPNSIWMGRNMHIQPLGGEKTDTQGQPITFKPLAVITRTSENAALLDAYTSAHNSTPTNT